MIINVHTVSRHDSFHSCYIYMALGKIAAQAVIPTLHCELFYTHTALGKIPSLPKGIMLLSLSRNLSGIKTRNPLTRNNSVLALAGSVSAIDFSCMNKSASWNVSTWLLGRHLNTCKNRINLSLNNQWYYTNFITFYRCLF